MKTTINLLKKNLIPSTKITAINACPAFLNKLMTLLQTLKTLTPGVQEVPPSIMERNPAAWVFLLKALSDQWRPNYRSKFNFVLMGFQKKWLRPKVSIRSSPPSALYHKSDLTQLSLFVDLRVHPYTFSRTYI